ncbi:GspH/FimT family pseudopilin [Bradyrhizobium sp. CCGUVB14]|uniref:GspH/FimT family pseudopilin n=1 Tax=Bradyrhizobium sp. CCGUVB14 TaxID=2949628 RepID=UPI0020B26B3E|nr:GspH/FimT family pseudopilin [Bradyrhizobium sp. CCGUVB14]MCP3442025.1 GspH/FimT family pseudopilin [Bradyrhizobium sp. CCGUVB14]
MSRIVSTSGGFSLIETLVVLSIMALVSAAVLAAKPRTAAARINAEARSMAASLQLARSRARARNAEIVVGVDTQNGRFGTADAMRRLPVGMDVSLTVAATERHGAVGGVRFYPDGRSSGGEILLTYRGRTERVVVNWFTGDARIE